MFTALNIITIYALQLTNDKYYIGKTSRDVSSRFQEHIDGFGSEWTRTYSPIKILETYDSDNTFEEDNLTKKYMMKYGIDNVRGGSYTKLVLDEWQVKSLEHEFKSTNDCCFKCGKGGHFANECEKYNHIELYLSKFETENVLGGEILRMEELRTHIENEKNKIEHLKYGKYKIVEGQGRQRKFVEKRIIIEPKIIDELKFNDYKYAPINSRSSDDVLSVGILYSDLILQRQIMPDGERLIYMNPNNVIENVYKVYVTWMKKEIELKKLLEQINIQNVNDYMSEINYMIEKLYKKYGMLLSKLIT